MADRAPIIAALTVGVIAIGLSAYSVSTIFVRPPSRVLVYDLQITAFNVNDLDESGGPSAADPFFAGADIFLKDQIGGPLAGKYTCYGTFSSGTDNIAVQLLDITGTGLIILNGPESLAGRTTGSVVGGTGEFTGISGSYALEPIGEGLFRYTITISSS